MGNSDLGDGAVFDKELAQFAPKAIRTLNAALHSPDKAVKRDAEKLAAELV
jgi:hypothetical protein